MKQFLNWYFSLTDRKKKEIFSFPTALEKIWNFHFISMNVKFYPWIHSSESHEPTRIVIESSNIAPLPADYVSETATCISNPLMYYVYLYVHLHMSKLWTSQAGLPLGSWFLVPGSCSLAPSVQNFQGNPVPIRSGMRLRSIHRNSTHKKNGISSTKIFLKSTSFWKHAYFKVTKKRIRICIIN